LRRSTSAPSAGGPASALAGAAAAAMPSGTAPASDHQRQNQQQQAQRGHGDGKTDRQKARRLHRVTPQWLQPRRQQQPGNPRQQIQAGAAQHPGFAQGNGLQMQQPPGHHGRRDGQGQQGRGADAQQMVLIRPGRPGGGAPALPEQRAEGGGQRQQQGGQQAQQDLQAQHGIHGGVLSVDRSSLDRESPTRGAAQVSRGTA